MTEEEIEQLLSPVSEASPSGENLEYDVPFLDLEREAAGKEERYSGVELIPAEDPNWKSVRSMATALLARTKDLRVAVHFARADAAVDGLDGLVSGLALVRGLLDRFWDDVHPRLDPDDGNDPYFRVNAVANLAGERGLPRILRRTNLVEARSLGRFTFRDLDIAEERMSPREDETPPSLELLKAALREAGSDYVSARIRLLNTAKDHLDGIDSLFRERAGGSAPDLDALTSLVNHGIAFMNGGVAQRQIVTSEASENSTRDTQSSTAHNAPVSSVHGSEPLRTRADAKRMLDDVCKFLEATEPSNPAPLLIRRAQRLIDRNFIDIIQDLAPEAFAQIETLAGIRAAAGDGSEQE